MVTVLQLYCLGMSIVILPSSGSAFFLTSTYLLLLLVGGGPRLAVLVVTLAASPGPLSAKQGFQLHHLAAGHWQHITTCSTTRTTEPTDPLTLTWAWVSAPHATSGWLSLRDVAAWHALVTWYYISWRIVIARSHFWEFWDDWVAWWRTPITHATREPPTPPNVTRGNAAKLVLRNCKAMLHAARLQGQTTSSSRPCHCSLPTGTYGSTILSQR
jgi:hypothetical protein